MEYALWENREEWLEHRKNGVLILVLMEYALWDYLEDAVAMFWS